MSRGFPASRRGTALSGLPPLAILALLAVLALLLPGSVSPAQAVPSPLLPQADCDSAIAAEEQAQGIPAGLLRAVALTESGRRLADGRLVPMPCT